MYTRLKFVKNVSFRGDMTIFCFSCAGEDLSKSIGEVLSLFALAEVLLEGLNASSDMITVAIKADSLDDEKRIFFKRLFAVQPKTVAA